MHGKIPYTNMISSLNLSKYSLLITCMLCVERRCWLISHTGTRWRFCKKLMSPPPQTKPKHNLPSPLQKEETALREWYCIDDPTPARCVCIAISLCTCSRANGPFWTAGHTLILLTVNKLSGIILFRLHSELFFWLPPGALHDVEHLHPYASIPI